MAEVDPKGGDGAGADTGHEDTGDHGTGGGVAGDAAAAWRYLLDGVRELDRAFLHGDRAVEDPTARAEGHRFLATVLGLALDVFLFADPAAPVLVDINAPDRPDLRWGGDNADASYRFCAVDPALTYRVTGTRGDSVYVSVTVYNQRAPGEWSDRIVGIVNDEDLGVGPGGDFEFLMGPQRPHGWEGPFIELSHDAAHVVTRDYQRTFDSSSRTRFAIEALDGPGATPWTPARVATAFHASRRWVEQQLEIAPLPLAARPADDALNTGHTGPAGVNEVADPYRVPAANFGWSAADACYAFGTVSLGDDEALLVTHRPPECRFWNLNLWNPYMATVDHPGHAVSLNGATAVPNADGSVTVVVTNGNHSHPNAVSTVGHARMLLAFRWFLAGAVPARPTAEVVPLGSAPSSPT